MEIDSAWDMIYDLEDGPDTPKYRVIVVNGWLTFRNRERSYHLKAEHIYVRAGQLHIGSPQEPFLGTARITLYGLKEFQTMVYDQAIEAGNKLIANTNKIKMYGKPR